MRVDMVSSYVGGGAGIAARRLHEGLLAAGIDSRFLYSKLHKQITVDETFEEFSFNRPAATGVRRVIQRVSARIRRSLVKWQIKRSLAGRPPGFEVFTPARLRERTPFDPSRITGDIVHLHWVSDWIDDHSFFTSVPPTKPLVWTLHDMNPFTGGCHHADGCELYQSECKFCPQLGQPAARDLANRSFRERQAVYRDKVLHIVTPSRWLEQHVRQSRLFGGAASIQTIRNGLDLRVFSPQDKSQARRALHLAPHKTIVGFGAASLKNRRKGFEELVAALSQLNDRSQVLGLGFGLEKLESAGRPMPELQTAGYVSDPAKQATIYSAMDLFVLPSWAENMPQTAVEALACGTPVVAFDVGGVPEIVQPMKTGLLAPLRDTQALTAHIQWLIDHPDQRIQMGRRARNLIEQEFDIKQQTARYIDLYRSILVEQFKPRAANQAA